MKHQLLDRVAELRGEIDRANGDAREELLDHLEQAALGLRAQGIAVPGWAANRLAARVDDEVEGQFDNMPV